MGWASVMLCGKLLAEGAPVFCFETGRRGAEVPVVQSFLREGLIQGTRQIWWKGIPGRKEQSVSGSRCPASLAGGCLRCTEAGEPEQVTPYPLGPPGHLVGEGWSRQVFRSLQKHECWRNTGAESIWSGRAASKCMYF